jgi:hypothetical protein
MYENLILPNQSAPFGQLLQNEVAYQREQDRYNQQLDQQNQYRQEQQIQQNRMSNLRSIDDVFDFKQYQTGEQAFDNYTMKELQAVKQKALTEYVNMNPVEMQYRLQQDMKPLIEWHTAGRGALTNMKKGLQDFNKTYPNIDLPSAENRMTREMFTDFFEVDDNGQPKRKPVEFIKQRDYTQSLQDPNVLGELVNDTSPFLKEIKSFPTSTIRDSDFVNNKGYKKGKKWSAVQVPGFNEIVLDKDGNPTQQVVAEDFPLPQGKSMKVLPEQTLSLLSPSASAALRGMYVAEKKRKGIKTEGAEDEILFRNFAYRQMEDFLPKGISIEETKTTPAPKITVNVNGAKKTEYATNIISGVEAALASKDEAKLKDALSELYGGNGAGIYSDVSFTPEGDIKIDYKVKDKSVLGQNIERPESIIIKKSDRYRKSKLKGVIQKIMGSDANLERTPSGVTGGANNNLQDIQGW